MKFEDILNNQEIKDFIELADVSLEAIGYTKHSFAHVLKCANDAKMILEALEYSDSVIQKAMIASYMHDIGNVINRNDHAHTGALLSYQLLQKLNMKHTDIIEIITAIGNHDETTANPINAITAALILADKSDVRRSRVRGDDINNFDIHDRVNYAVTSSKLSIDKINKFIFLILDLDLNICSVMDYFEIFLNRMNLCKKAAKYFDYEFKLIINDLSIT